MTKKLTALIVAAVLAARLLTISAGANTTSTVEGATPPEFAANTSVELNGQYGGYPENIDKSKNSQLIPPPFGAADFNFPADKDNFLTPGIATYSAVPVPADYVYEGHIPDELWAGEDWYTNEATSETIPGVAGNRFTAANELVNGRGILGTLSIPAIGLSVTVYEGESLANLAKGVGHFSETSAWDGNVAIAGHNRGSANYFGQIHTLVTGDLIEYATALGTKQYKVVSVGRISETDMSGLEPASDNRITLITCVRNVPELRWQVVAVEVL
jgi:sortase A